MKHRIVVVAAWVLATFVTALVAWGAVNVAGDQVAEQTVRPLSAREIEALPGTAPASAPVTSSTTSTSAVSPTSAPETSATPPVGTNTTSTSIASSPGGTSPTSTPSLTSAPASTTTTAAEPTSTTAAPTTTTTTPPREVTAHQLTGGKVVISAAPGVVTLVSWTPNPGFSGEVEKSGPDEVRVQFESDDHESEFRARWQGGELRIEKEEKAEN